MHCSLTLKQSSLTQQRSLLLACLVSFWEGSCRTLARPEQQCDLSCVSCRAASWAAQRHTLTRPPPCTLYFPPFCPRPHTLQPATGHMVGGRTVNTNTRKIHSNTQLSARTAALLTNVDGVRKILDILSRYLDRHQERCIVTAGPGSTAGGGQADSHGPRSSLVEAAA